MLFFRSETDLKHIATHRGPILALVVVFVLLLVTSHTASARRICSSVPQYSTFVLGLLYRHQISSYFRNYFTGSLSENFVVTACVFIR